MMKRDECLRVLARHVTDEIVVATYQAAFDWLVIRPHPLNYVSIGAMGLASSHAFGLALGRPDKRVIVLDGDGSLLMNLGSLVSIAEAAPRNLIHFVCENGTYEANGAHPIPGRDRVSFSGFARAAGYRSAHEIAALDDFAARIASLLREDGPILVDLKLEPGKPSPQDYDYIHSRAAREAFRAALRAS
jgi:thiamine pyrophosphate-dependent acetolactate synthase large subunit-like protein